MDDAYYYFTIAKNIAAGKGVSFDGISVTNGFHPLYLVLIVPIFWLFPHDLELDVQIILSMVMVFNTLTALPLYVVLKRTVSRTAGWVAAIAWLFNPMVVLIAMEGVESSLYVFFVALTVSVYLHYARERFLTFPRLVAIGISMGLTILARSDGIFLFFVIAADLLLGWRSWEGRHALLGLIVICGVVLAPWVLWNLSIFGTIVQVSGAAIFQESHLGGMSSWQQVASTLWRSSSQVFQSIAVQSFQVYFVALPVIVSLVFPRYRHQILMQISEWVSKIKSMTFLFLYAFLLFAFYAWYLLHTQLWYFLPILFVVTVASGVLYDLFRMGASVPSLLLEQGLATVMATILVIIFSLAGWFWQSRDLASYPAQYDGYQIAQWLSRETDPRARIGAWNSGIIGYFANRTVVNLDGVVNNPLYAYVVSQNSSFDLKDIWGYVQETHLDYITDYEDFFPQSFETEFAEFLQLAYEFPSTYSHKYKVKVFRVLR